MKVRITLELLDDDGKLTSFCQYTVALQRLVAPDIPLLEYVCVRIARKFWSHITLMGYTERFMDTRKTDT